MVTTKQLRDEACHEIRHGGYVRCVGYMRGRGRLACVLGIVIDVYMRHFGDLKVEFGGDQDGEFYSFDGETLQLPDRVRKAFGFASPWSHFTDSRGNETSLARLSDQGTPFHVIADLIESRPPGLFIDSPPPEPAEVVWGDHDSAQKMMLRTAGACSPSQDEQE
jgi:hypothetical protein